MDMKLVYGSLVVVVAGLGLCYFDPFCGAKLAGAICILAGGYYSIKNYFF